MSSREDFEAWLNSKKHPHYTMYDAWAARDEEVDVLKARVMELERRRDYWVQWAEEKYKSTS